MRTIEEVLQEFKDQGLCLEPKDENGCSVDILLDVLESLNENFEALSGLEQKKEG
jgi:hypothetical protein